MSDSTPTAPAADPDAQAAQAAPQPSQAAAPTPTQAAGSVDDLPEWARKEIAELRRESAAQRKARQEAAEAAAKADEQRLEQERKYAELAEKRASRIAELLPHHW